MMKRHLLFVFTVLLPLLASAEKLEKIEIDGICYNLNTVSKQAEVTRSYLYMGSITIPATVTYDGVEYRVTSIGEDAFR